VGLACKGISILDHVSMHFRLIFLHLGRSFQPTKIFYLFLCSLLKHAQNPLLVFLGPSSLPKNILLFFTIVFVPLIPTHVSYDALFHIDC
jgi:hypothetical protein